MCRFSAALARLGRHSTGATMDFLFLLLAALLWGLMALLVRGLDKLAPAREQRP
jgi:hypothetical protein